MKLKTFLTIHAVLAGFFGIGFMVTPEMVTNMMAMPPGFDATHGWRYFGTAIAMVGVLAWFARNADDSVARRAILKAFVFGYALMTVYHLISVFVHGIVFTPMLGGVMALHVAFTVIYAVFLGQSGRRDEPRRPDELGVG